MSYQHHEENQSQSRQQPVGTEQPSNQRGPMQLVTYLLYVLYLWTLRPILILLKYTFCIDTVHSVVHHTKTYVTESKSRMANAYRRSRKLSASEHFHFRNGMTAEECFEHEVARSRYHQNHIRNVLNIYRDLWFACLLASVGSVWVGLLNSDSFWYGFSGLCVLLQTHFGFVHFNLRHGRIVAFGRPMSYLRWLLTPSEWVPPGPGGGTGRIIVGCFTAAILASAGSAMAQTAAMTSVDVFGLFTQVIAGATGFSAAMQIFLCQLTVLGTFFLAGCIIVGNISTAHEGKVLGKSHQIWTPLKWVVGLGSLAPYNGVNLAMTVVLSVAGFGNGIADLETVAYVQSIANPSLSVTYTPVGVQPTTAGIAVVKQMLINETCQASYATTAKFSGSNADYVPPSPPLGGTPIGTDTVRYSWGRCGTIELSSSAITAQVDQSAINQYLSSWDAAFSKALGSIRSSNEAQNFALSRQPGSGVQAPTAVMTPLKPIASQYESDVNTAAATLLSSTGTWSQYASSITHWPLLGVSAMTLAAMQNQVSSIMSILPEMVQPSLGDSILNYDITREADRTVKLILERWNTEVEADNAAAGPSTSVITDITADGSDDWLNGSLSKILNPVTVAGLQEFGSSSPTNALAVECDFGHRLVNASFAMMGATTVSMVAVGNTAGQVTGVLAGAQWLSGFAWFIIAALLSAGVVSAYLVPLWPFMCMISAVTGYLIALMEAYITIPFTSLFTIKMSGDQLMDEHLRPGALMILRISVHPSLIALSFMLVASVVSIMLYVIDVYYPMAFIAAQAGHLSVVTGNVVALWIMGFLKFQTVMRFYAFPIQIIGKLGHLINGMSRDSQGEGQLLQQFQSGSDPSGGMGQGIGKLEHGSSQGMGTLASASKRHNSVAPMNP